MNAITRNVSLPFFDNGARSIGTAGCRVCDGTGWELIEDGGTDWARRCACRREKSALDWERIGISPSNCRSTLKQYLRRGVLPVRTKRKFQDYVRQYPEVPGALFVIHDDPGKASRISVALLKEIVRVKQRSARFYDCSVSNGSAASGGKGQDAAQPALPDDDGSDVAVFDSFFDSSLEADLQLRWVDLLHQRYLAQRHSILTCGVWTFKSLHRAMRGGATELPPEVFKLFKNLAGDAAWCWLFHRGIQERMPLSFEPRMDRNAQGAA